jgi:hypothetical protein
MRARNLIGARIGVAKGAGRIGTAWRGARYHQKILTCLRPPWSSDLLRRITWERLKQRNKDICGRRSVEVSGVISKIFFHNQHYLLHPLPSG